MTHLCHALRCTRPCPPQHLMCLGCWRLVEPETQLAVHRTARQRGPVRDASWAAWWRAQAIARAEVARASKASLDVDAWLTAQMRIADQFEKQSAARAQGACP